MVKKLKYIFLALGLFLVIIFLINLDFDDYKSEDNLFSSEINLKITEDSLHRGFIKLDNGILLSQNCPETVRNRAKTKRDIGMVEPPYQLKKELNDSIFLVIKGKDSFFFSMIDYSKDRFKDQVGS